jgi:putative spermidine/putrescine transport system permease protein
MSQSVSMPAAKAAGTSSSPPGRRRGRWNPVLTNWQALLMVLPLLALLVGLVLYPLVKLTIDSLTTDAGLGNYGDVLSSSSSRRALITTLLASAVVTAVCVGVGGVLAWYLVSARSTAVKAVIWLAVLMPFWMGTVVKNYAIVLLVSREGLINDVLGAVGIGPVQILYTSGAVIAGIVYSMIPYAVFSLYGVLVGIDQSLVAAARSMGASRTRAIGTIVLPLAMPGIVASAAIVFAISVGFYVTPVLLGGGQAPYMASLISANIFGFYDYGFASAASVILLVVALVILGATLALVGRERLVRAVA